MEVDDAPTLKVLASLHTTHPISPEKAVICSPHDLIAIVTHTNDVVVYRLNGQIAFPIKNPVSDGYDDEEESIQVTCLRWSPDGRRLAVAWSDGTWSVREGEKGGVLLDDNVRNPLEENSTTTVVGFGWEQHPLTNREADSWMSTTKAHKVDNEANEAIAGSERAGSSPDFPSSVTLLDPTAVLPKLSAMPSHGLRAESEEMKFANQAATDSIFARSTFGTTEKAVEIMLVYSSDGRVRVLLDGTSHIGTVKTKSTTAAVKCISDPDSSRHVLMSRTESSELFLNILDLPLPKLGGAMLHMLSHTTSQLSSLTSYVRRATLCISHDLTSGLSYPKRLKNNVSMSLEEDTDSSATLLSALTHLAMTGEFHPAVLEWLSDIVKETGLKRWEASISGMYTAIQTHLHSHILPALDRISIAATSIRGLARFHQGSASFEPEEASFTSILDAVDGLRLLSLKALLTCTHEWALWRAFAKWLRMEIEVAAAGPGSKGAAEAEERESVGIEYADVLQYIHVVLESGSELRPLLQQAQRNDSLHVDLDMVKAFVDDAANESRHNDLALGIVVQWLEKTVQLALEKVGLWQGRMFTSPIPLRLDLVDAGQVCDISWTDGGTFDSRYGSNLTMLTVSEEQERELKVYHLENVTGLDTENSSTLSRRVEDTSSQRLQGIVDARTLHNEGSVLLLRCSPSVATNQAEVFELVKTDHKHRTVLAVHVFPRTEQFVPRSLIVGGRRGREFCVVFGEGSRSWQVLDLHKAATKAAAAFHAD